MTKEKVRSPKWEVQSAKFHLGPGTHLSHAGLVRMMSHKPRVTLVCTAGTISMRFDPVSGGAVPALTGQAVLDLVPDLTQLAGIEVVDFSLLPGPHMMPARMLELANLIRTLLAADDQDGIVVTHGTDTLEECAYL